MPDPSVIPNPIPTPNPTQANVHAGAHARGGVRRTAGQAPGGVNSETDAERRLTLERRSSQELHRIVSWVDRNLPNEAATFAVGAFILEKFRWRRDPTVEEVMARLQTQGRDRATIEKTDPLILECSTWGENQQRKKQLEACP